MLRAIVRIDEDLCDGCGLCIPSCAEGALQITGGKAKLISDKLCDGLGACLGQCPKGAIKVEQREAEGFDEQEVKKRLQLQEAARQNAMKLAQLEQPCACPGSKLRMFAASPGRSAGQASKSEKAKEQGSKSALTHWPVQLRLLSAYAPVLQQARLLVAADCVPVAFSDFHSRFLAGHAVVIGCPKFDDMQEAVNKLAAMILANQLQEITVARMTVPCCSGILQAVLKARELSGVPVPVKVAVIAPEGEIMEEKEV